jgi:transcriptional regulator with XRE-family HTH domain
VDKKRKPTVVEQLREAITQSGIPLNQLSKASGVHRSQLSRFLRGERDISLEGASAICQALGLELAHTTAPSAEKAKPTRPKKMDRANPSGDQPPRKPKGE